MTPHSVDTPGGPGLCPDYQRKKEARTRLRWFACTPRGELTTLLECSTDHSGFGLVT